jgi:hypothetical protein
MHDLITFILIFHRGHGLDYNDLTPSIAAPSGEGIADLYTALVRNCPRLFAIAFTFCWQRYLTDLSYFKRLNDSCIGRGFYVNGRCNTGGDACDSCTGVRDIDYMKKAKKQPSTYTWAYGPTGDGSGKCNKSGKKNRCRSLLLVFNRTLNLSLHLQFTVLDMCTLRLYGHFTHENCRALLTTTMKILHLKS